MVTSEGRAIIMDIKQGFWNCCRENPDKLVAFDDDREGAPSGALIWHHACTTCASTVHPSRVLDAPDAAVEPQRTYVFTMPSRAPMIREIDDEAGLWVRAFDQGGMEVELLIMGLNLPLIKAWIDRDASDRAVLTLK